MNCAIVGDSIAVGVAHAMPECASNAAVGVSAVHFVRAFTCSPAPVVVISLGSNSGPDDEKYLRIVRGCYSERVIWLLPPAHARDTVRRIAHEFGDRIVDVRDSGASVDQIHPNVGGYSILAKEIRVNGR